MVVVSISLTNKLLDEIDKIQNQLGFSGRSDVLRAGARLLIAENKERENLLNKITSILLIIHNQKTENIVSDIKHKFEDITKTQIHSHLEQNKCLEIFVLNGDARRIREMARLFQISKKIEYTKLITP